jgi:hypothetical protein
MLQLREDRPLCQRLLPAQARQLTVSSNTRVEPAEGPSSTIWSRQLHYHGGNLHERGSASGYVLPQ